MNIEQTIKNTDRNFYGDYDIANTSPKKIEGKLEFFTIGKYISDDELEKEYKSRRLIPADLYTLCEKNDFENDFVATHWKDADGKWYFAAFYLWRGERSVDVDRRDRDWNGRWWFAGVRKSSVIESSELSDTLTLEKAIEIVKKEGYIIYKTV